MVLNADNVGKLEEAAAKRKERLLGLKNRKKKQTSDETSDHLAEPEVETHQDLPTSQVLFRNYQPQTDKLQDAVLPQIEPTNIEELVQDQLKHAENSNQIADVEINNLAPKKLTYDLRRGIQAQLDKLEKRTDKAIAELIRERLKEGRQQDFLLAVNAGARVSQKQNYDSDED